MRTVMTSAGAFGFYAGLNLVAWAMIFCFVRETKELTLEELDQVFSIPTRQFLNYEMYVHTPYWIKKNILRRDIPRPPPLLEKLPADPSKRKAEEQNMPYQGAGGTVS